MLVTMHLDKMAYQHLLCYKLKYACVLMQLNSLKYLMVLYLVLHYSCAQIDLHTVCNSAQITIFMILC